MRTISLKSEQEERCWKFITGDDLDFYEEYTIFLSDEEQKQFFAENPDFMSEYPVDRQRMYLLRDPMYRAVLKKIKEYEEDERKKQKAIDFLEKI